jgi:hypothetical protein
MPLPVAINGTISLQAPQPLTKRAMIIRMSDETLDALAAYPVQPPLQFEFGDTPVCNPLSYSSCVGLTTPLPLPTPRASTSAPHSSPCEGSKSLPSTNFIFAPL